MKGLKGWLWLGGAVAVAAVLLVVLRGGKPGAVGTQDEGGRADVQVSLIAEAEPAVAERPAPSEAEAQETATEATAEPQTDEERAEAEAEKRVDAFDALTDKWMEPSAKGVAMSDVDAFVKQFASVPPDRKDECLHRALNLIPDENVMLLAGILMDKTQDRELVELVFNDVLNRDEDVKKPIMLQVFKDKTHPCWADVAWILDVTGEIPAKK